MVFSALFGKNSDYNQEYEAFKKALKRSPSDAGLKSQFIKFCLLNRFTKHEAMEEHVSEALRLFEAVEQSDLFDLQCHYLVGKYSQEVQNQRNAYRIYLNALKRFNRHSVRNPELKGENVEMAYSIALNLLALQSDPVDPELEICFKLIRKSLPLHLKRVELENEMSKPAADPARIKQISEEIRKLKAEEEKSAAALAEAKQAALALSEQKKDEAEETESLEGDNGKGKEGPSGPSKEAAAMGAGSLAGPKAIFSKLFMDLAPNSVGLAGAVKMEAQGKKDGPGRGEKGDLFKISPLYDYTDNGATFMAYHDDQWVGPYTAFQLRKMDFFKPGTWVCRVGNQQVLQAYEVPEIQPLFHHQLQ